MQSIVFKSNIYACFAEYGLWGRESAPAVPKLSVKTQCQSFCRLMLSFVGNLLVFVGPSPTPILKIDLRLYSSMSFSFAFHVTVASAFQIVEYETRV